MNRGVEIGSEVADDIDRSLIRQQVEMGVAVRMACLEILTRDLGNGPPMHREPPLRRYPQRAGCSIPESGLDATRRSAVEGDRIAAVGARSRDRPADDAEIGRCRRAVPRARARRHARAVARARRRAHGVDRERRAGRGGGRGHDDGGAAQHRAAGRRRLGRRVPRAPRARGRSSPRSTPMPPRPRGCTAAS